MAGGGENVAFSCLDRLLLHGLLYFDRLRAHAFMVCIVRRSGKGLLSRFVALCFAAGRLRGTLRFLALTSLK